MLTVQELRKRRRGIAVSLFSVAATLVATLTPVDIATPLAGPWCLVCGQHGTIDVVQNILLFVPLGIGLCWGGMTRPAAIAASFILTLLIEGLQLAVVPGRDGALGDVIANTLGAAIGFSLAAANFRAMRPSPALASRQFAGVVGLWILLVSLSIAALRPHLPAGPFALIVPTIADADHFQGTLSSTHVNGIPVSSTAAFRRGDPVVEGLLGERSAVRMAVVPAGPTPHYVTIARFASLQGTAFAFGQAGRNFVCSRSLLASAFRLRTPAFSLPGAFLPGDPLIESDAPVHNAGVLHELECRRAGPSVLLRRRAGDQNDESTVRLHPGVTWSLFVSGTLMRATTAIQWPNVAWLLVLATPLGFYGFFASTSALATTQHRARRVLTPSLIALVAILGVQLVVPGFAAVAPSPWWEIAGSVSGIALGAAVALLSLRMFGGAEARDLAQQSELAPLR